MIATVYGKRARFCGASCRDGFKADRRMGLIYPAVLDNPKTGKTIPWEDGSMKYKFCAYCKADVSGTKQKSKKRRK